MLELFKRIILVIYLFLGWSWPFSVHTGIPFAALFLLLFAATVLIAFIENSSINRIALSVVFVSLGVVFLFASVAQNMVYLSRVMVLPLTFLCFLVLFTRQSQDSVCDGLSLCALVAVLLSLVGFAYAFLGGEHLGVIKNPDGRGNALFLTTYSNATFGNIIRPSFWYDEPGSLSFFICTVVVFREILGKSRKLSIVLMLGGIITFSLTHLLVCLLYSQYIYRYSIYIFGFLVALLLGLLLPFLDFLDFFLSRFEVVDGRLAGDNRSREIDYYMESITSNIFVFGNAGCYVGNVDVCSSGPITATPLAPNYRQGLIGLTYQAVVSLYLFLVMLCSKAYRVPALILFLLLLQRPYYSAFGYSALIILILFAFEYRLNILTSMGRRLALAKVTK